MNIANFNILVKKIRKLTLYLTLGCRRTFSPKPKPGKSKYGPSNGLVTHSHFKNLPIPLSMAEALSKAANSGLSTQTWSSYKTAKNHLDRCQQETKVLMTFPLTTEKVLVYISWLLFQRKVKAKSAEVYVSGLRCLLEYHSLLGLEKGILLNLFFNKIPFLSSTGQGVMPFLLQENDKIQNEIV